LSRSLGGQAENPFGPFGAPGDGRRSSGGKALILSRGARGNRSWPNLMRSVLRNVELGCGDGASEVRLSRAVEEEKASRGTRGQPAEADCLREDKESTGKQTERQLRAGVSSRAGLGCSSLKTEVGCRNVRSNVPPAGGPKYSQGCGGCRQLVAAEAVSFVDAELWRRPW
jgi:hypothetical protein